MNRIVKCFSAALAIGVAGLLVAGCSKSGSRGGGGGGVVNSITLTAELADTGAQPFELQQNQTRNFALVVKSNGLQLNASDYTVNASSNNPTVATAGVDANKNVVVTAMSVVGLEATIEATVGYLQASPVTVRFRVKVIGTGNSGTLTILIDQTTRTVNTFASSPITVTVSENGANTQLMSNQYNLELTNNASNIGSVSVLDNNRWQFTASGNTGTCNLKVNVTNFNGKTGSKTFDNAITVVTSGGGGGGGSGSGGTGNVVPGLTYTAITLSTPGQANAGQGLQLTVTATRTDGSTTTNASDLRYDRTSTPDFVSVDADGKVYFRRNSDTCTVRAFQKGQQTSDATERWAEVLWSNTLTVNSSATAPVNLVMLKFPANPMVGERQEFQVWDCVSNTDVTSTATVTFSDNTVLQRVSNQSSQNILLEARKTGTCTVSFTANGRSGSFAVRVIQFNPRIWTRNSKNVLDTHLRPGQPFVNPNNSLENWLPLLVCLEYCKNQAGTVVKTNPSLYRFIGNISGTTPPTPELRFTDENSQEWALFYIKYGGTSGTYDTENFQYVGNTRNPIDLNADVAWSADKQFSAGQTGTGSDNFRLNINRQPVGAEHQVTVVTN